MQLPDLTEKRKNCDKALNRLLEVVGDTPIAIDYTFCPRPLSLARLLLDHGFRVERVYLDAVTGEEKADLMYLKENHPDLLLYPTIHAAMRFHSPKETSDFLEKLLVMLRDEGEEKTFEYIRNIKEY